MYYFKLVSLEGCPYSLAGEELFKNNKINHELIKVKYNEKDKFKTDIISTFPQIYLKKKYSNGSLLVGGYDDIKSYYDIVNTSTKKSDNIISEFKNIINKKIDNISEKSILRIIQLLSK
jgi:glutaredoxin